MKRYIVFIVLFVVKINAQDIHTSQIQEYDYLYNPAMVGNFKGNYRANLSSRSQWSSINKAFQTYSFSADAGFFKNKWKSGNLGVGLSANSDNAGNGFLKSNNVNIGLSGVVNLNKKNNLSMGILSSFTQSSIDPSAIIWGTQFDGNSYNSNLPTQEMFFSDQFSFFDVSAGLAWSFSKQERNLASYDETRFQLGLAAYHLNSPKMYNQISTDTLFRRYVLYGKGFIGLSNSNTALLPHVLVQKQGPNMEILAGTYFRIRIKEASKVTGFVKESALSLGASWRYGDAIIPAVVFELSSYSIGLSYDVNISNLNSATNMMGGLEITFRFLNPSPFAYKSFKPSL